MQDENVGTVFFFDIGTFKFIFFSSLKYVDFHESIEYIGTFVWFCKQIYKKWKKYRENLVVSCVIKKGLGLCYKPTMCIYQIPPF